MFGGLESTSFSQEQSQHASNQHATNEGQAGTSTSVGKLWRNDGRCGDDNWAEEGEPGVCPTPEQFMAAVNDPDRKSAEPFLRNAPCCAASGWCGSAWAHCSCRGCLDFRPKNHRFPSEPRQPEDDDITQYHRRWRRGPYVRPSPKSPKRPSRVAVDQVSPRKDWPLKARSNKEVEYPQVDHSSVSVIADSRVSVSLERGVITSLVFLLCVFCCHLLIRRSRSVAGRRCLYSSCLAGLAFLAISPYIGFFVEHALTTDVVVKAHPVLPSQYQKANLASNTSSQASIGCGKFVAVTPLHFGAIGNGSTDDTEAVSNCLAYVSRCPQTLAVLGPTGYRFWVRPGQLNVTLNHVRLKFEGELVGPTLKEWNPRRTVWPVGSCAYGESGCSTNQKQSPEFVRSRWTLLHIRDSTNLTIEGPGGLRAPGDTFWKVRNRRPEVVGYCLLKLERGKYVRIRGLQLTDSPMYHVVIMYSNNVDMYGLSIVVNDLTVGDSGPHNTDGISIISSENVRLTSSEVESGDDNVVIKEGSRGIVVEDVSLFRGKGVSIGSLGERAAEDQNVSDIFFHNVKLYYSMHGARIKTWIGSQGYVKNVTFDSFSLENVDYGILIDQNYCPLSQRPEGCGQSDDTFSRTAIVLQDVTFQNFSGTYMNEGKKITCVRCRRVTTPELNLKRSPDAFEDAW